MAYPAGPGPYIPPQPRRGSTGALVMLVIGAVMLIGGGVTALLGARTVSNAGGGFVSDFEPVGGEVDVPEVPGVAATLDVTVREGSHSIYARFPGQPAAPGNEGGTDGPDTTTPLPTEFDIDLSVSGPGGEAVPLSGLSLAGFVDSQMGRVSVATFDVDQPGGYRITVTRKEVTGQNEARVTSVGVRRTNFGGEGFGEALAGGLAIGLGALIAMAGFPFFVAGGIWWLVSRSRANQTNGPLPGGWAPPGGWTPPPGSGGPYGSGPSGPPPPPPPPSSS